MKPRPAQPTHPWDLLLGRWSIVVAIMVVAGAVAGAAVPGLLEPGVDLCWFHRASGLPCPGCGLTRSVVHLVRGQWAASLAFHPFGGLVLLWAAVASSSRVWPSRWRAGLRGWLGRHARGVRRVYWTLVSAFIAFGVARTILVLLGALSFP